MIKRWLGLWIVLAFLCVVPVFAAQQPQISAESAVMYDPLSNTVLYEKNAHQRRGMASTTKIMTALVALSQYDLSEEVTIQQQWCGIEGSSMYLKAGEKLTISDLLYGLLLSSGNDAAAALAGLDPQGPDRFVDKMNAMAASLGLENTHFDNPSGLDGETHYTTALELARLTAYAMKDPVFSSIVGTERITMAQRDLHNHNRLLSEIGACGVKTGFTKACGRCLVSAKEQNGRMLICVTLNDPDDWKDHRVLYDYGFAQYVSCELLGAGDCGSVPLISSEKAASRLYCNESFSFWLTPEEQQQVQMKRCGPRFWYGATESGSLYGCLQIWLNQELLFETPVYFADQVQASVPESSPPWWDWIKSIFRRKEP